MDAAAARATGGVARHAALFVALAIGQGVFRFASRRLFLGNARRVEHDLRARYFRQLLRLPTEQIEAGHRGDFTSRATHDLQDVRLFLGAGALNFVQTAVLLGCAAVLLARLHPTLTAVALAPFPVITALVRWHSPRLHSRYRAANASAGDLSAAVQEALDGLRLVRAFGREDWQRERFERRNLAQRDAQVRVVRTWVALFPAVGVLAGLGQVAVLGYGGALVFAGALSVGEFVAFTAYLAMLTWPMVALGWTLGLVQRGAAALERLRPVLEHPGEPRGTLSPDAAAPVALAAQEVAYRYPQGTADAVTEVAFAQPAGSCWALAGGTGAGKTTLVELLARLRRPTRGSLQVGGRELAGLDHPALRRHLAVVPQQGTFFAASIAENLRLGLARPDHELWRALELAGLADEVAAFPQGLDTPVGEGGVTLSGGQRQRLALARALLREPRVLLLDAAFSSLDARTASRVLGNLRRALPDATLLVVSHRGAEVARADGVLFLRAGRIIARGRHRDLLRTEPAYRALFREQALRRRLAEAAE